MKIEDVKTAVHVADVVARNDKNKNKIKMKWSNEVPLSFLKNNNGRVYLIVVDGIIYKIGGSQCKGGIKGTWSFYCGAMNGSPSVRTYGIPVLIRECLDVGQKVSVWMINSESVIAPVLGLFGSAEQKVGIDFKAIEDKCKNDYLEIVGDYPVWNIQEANKSWPRYIQEACNALNEETSKKSKRNK